MSAGRLRSGELLAAGGAVALLALLPLRWFGGAPATGTGGLGWAAVAVLVAASLAALATAAVTVRERSPTLPVALDVVTALLGALALLVLAIRLLAAEAVRLPAVLALPAALLVAAGAWRAMADERTDAPRSREQTERLLRAAGPPRRVTVDEGELDQD